jgi:hypothetical protein
MLQILCLTRGLTMDSKAVSIVVVALGALLLLASLTADMTGLGDGGFGSKQMIGAVVGILVLGVGAYLYKKSGKGDRPGD